MPSTAIRFPIRFDAAYRALSAVLRLSPSESYVDVDEYEVRVRMGWGFRTRFARSSVAAVTAYGRRPFSRGIHGWAGRWLVNGSGDGIVSIALDPPERGWVMGFPVRLRTLLVSVEDPERVIASLAVSPPGHR
jgi:hypothetical protein